MKPSTSSASHRNPKKQTNESPASTHPNPITKNASITNTNDISNKNTNVNNSNKFKFKMK